MVRSLARWNVQVNGWTGVDIVGDENDCAKPSKDDDILKYK